MKRLSRRRLLCGAGGVAMALPFLDVMRPKAARAQDGAIPRRVLFLFQANGDETDARFSATGETSFELGEFLSPLEPYRDELVFLNRLDKRFFELPAGQRSDNHQQGGSSLAPWVSGAGSFPIGGTEDETIGYVEGPSVDYALGERVLEADPSVAHRHLVYRVGGRHNDIWNLHAHAGPVGQQNPVAPETDPYAAYARLFSFPPSDPEAEALLMRQLHKKRSAIDLVLEELGDLRGRVDASDRRKIDQHTEAVRDIERSLGGGMASDACAPLDLGVELDPYEDDNHVAVGELFFKISALAFACDRSRVINFNWSGNTSNRVYRNLDLSEGHHDISHEGSSESFDIIRRIHTHLWQQNTKLYEILKNTPEGDGSLWDHTLIVHWNELGQGDVHSVNDSLVVLAGGAHGYFRGGRLIDYDNDASFSDMLVSCFHYMGFDDVTEFGDERLRMLGALPDITA